MLITVEINNEKAFHFLEKIQEMEGFVEVTHIDGQTQDILLPIKKAHIPSLRLSKPFLTSEQIEHDFQQMRAEWDNI